MTGGSVPPDRFWPNVPAAEYAAGEYHGDPNAGVFGTGTVTGNQPEGPNNPEGDLPGVPVASLGPEAWSALSGPQKG